MTDNATIDCPWCGARFDAVVDSPAEDQAYTEDCHVCCQPIEFCIETDAFNNLTRITVRRENE